jgi:hypothetical protein
MRRCEDEKMRYRPPLLEEPCAQTLSGKYGLGAGSIPNEKQGNACAKGNDLKLRRVNEPMSKAHKINSSKGQRDKNYPTS